MSDDGALAINGGPKAAPTDPGPAQSWPIITEEDERAVLEVLRRRAMSGRDVTLEFEKEYAEWHGVEYALGHSSGTAALQAAMWACGVGIGDEIIAPSMTYWATALPVFSLQGTMVYGDVHPDTLTLDPEDIEHRITERTKAIIPVHLGGYPADMDPIMEIAERHGLKVIEDVSHAHGASYKGRVLGTIGHVGCFSIMSGKALATGEGGILITNDRYIWEKATAWGHHGRTSSIRWAADMEEPVITEPDLLPYKGMPMGGYKYRMHQLTSAVARVQLKYYRPRMEEILKAMNYFWDLLEDVPGLQAHRPAKDSGSHMGGWYAPRGIYKAEELNGLPLDKYAEAVQAEGGVCSERKRGGLHLHPLMQTADIYGHGKPTRIANSEWDVREGDKSLPVTEMEGRIYGIPWFKHYWCDVIEEQAAAYRKVAEKADEVPRE
jgi:perosamine synthetase